MHLRTLITAAALFALLALAACGQSGVDRVDVTWDVSPPPRWGLYPGYRQEIPCPAGAVYTVNVFHKGKSFTNGAVANLPGGLAFKPIAGARDITAETPDADHLVISVRIPAEKGESPRTQVALRIERQGDKIVFEFPK
jgi:hypothetical protein